MIPIRDTIPSRTTPGVNWVLIGLNVSIFLLMISSGKSGAQTTVEQLGIIPSYFTQHGGPWEYFTLLSSMFLHGGWFHLFSNMLALYIFGDNVEDRLGHGRFLVFYLVCGLAAGLTHVLLNTDSTVPTIGASGAIAGVLGAYLVLYPHARVLTLVPIFYIPYFFEIPALLYLGIWFLSQLLNGTMAVVYSQATSGGGVAWWAHAGGFVAGAALVLLMQPRRPPRWR